MRWRLMAVDGSEVGLPLDPDLAEAFGTPLEPTENPAHQPFTVYEGLVHATLF